LTKEQASANYGGKISKKYFVISLTLINNSDKSMLLQAVSFAPTVANREISALPIATVLQDVQREESLDVRTRTEQILTYLSLILPGPTPFFRNVASRGTYNQALSIFNLGRTSAFTTFPDYLDKVIQLLQSNKLFIQNSQIGAHLPVTIDTFMGRHQVPDSSQKTNPPRKGHFDPIAVLKALGPIKVYFIEMPSQTPPTTHQTLQ
jgi:hypothetical protein